MTTLLGAALAAAPAVAGLPGALFIAGEHSPPASWKEDGQVTGRETDKIRAMLLRAGVPYQIDILPWKRAYTLALQQPATCVYSTSRTPEREHQFKWIGPTDQSEWVFIGRADHKFPLRTLEDARPLRIGTYHGDARDEFLRTRGFHVEPVQSDASNPKKLLLNRIDLWAIGMRSGNHALAQFPAIERGELAPLLTFHKVKVYLACNPALPDALVDKLNAALDGMRRDGTYARLERKYALLEKRK
ncbi:ABC transporter substrate-binding protein [Massilia sp. Root351]|uniref:substrate-binding periplasmic protein n=1 Tax=Massilia sp. Root351 TaxID=1736522 RepID=UPI000B182918|nr:transporter substrate-binding domain-containing protein [Massilia sp. Root351]